MQPRIFRFKNGTGLVAGLMLLATSAAAQPACAERDSLVRRLADVRGQAPAAVGLTEGGRFVELLSSSGGRTWTLIVSNGDGTSCTIATGKGWLAYPADLAQRDPKA